MVVQSHCSGAEKVGGVSGWWPGSGGVRARVASGPARRVDYPNKLLGPLRAIAQHHNVIV